MDTGILIDYAKSFYGVPYVYGGDDHAGVDCSGYISELMRAAGMIGNKERLNAQQLYERFSLNGSHDIWAPCSLAFYGGSVAGHIIHVSMLLDSQSCIEGGGGDSTTVNLSQAIERNAFVRIRPIKLRKDFLMVLRPRYPWLLGYDAR